MQSIMVGEVRAAKRDGTCMNQLIASAVAKKLSDLESMDFFNKRAKRADSGAFYQFMSRTDGVPLRVANDVPEGYKAQG